MSQNPLSDQTQSSSQAELLVASFYHFAALPEANLKSLSSELESRATALGVRGLAILATEGINATVAGPEDALRLFIKDAAQILALPPFATKDTWSPFWPFANFKVRLRQEIVTLGKPEVQPLPPQSVTHLSPDEWDTMMIDPDAIVVDTRNRYETRIGKFAGAIDPDIEEFAEFSHYMNNSGIEKDKKILIYCTGGIRCEKATVDLKNMGFENVFQLDGGIINYFMSKQKKPHSKFEGECFVFDHRVAIDQDLNPTAK
jgi:UPF0176 protein